MANTDPMEAVYNKFGGKRSKFDGEIYPTDRGGISVADVRAAAALLVNRTGDAETDSMLLGKQRDEIAILIANGELETPEDLYDLLP